MQAGETRFEWPPHGPALRGFRLEGTVPGGIFVHGFRSHCDGEKSVSLARHAAIRGRSWVRYNQRHCGPDSGSFARFTIGQSIHDLASILDFIGQPVILVGSSLGGVISLQAARHRPDIVRGLLLIAPAIRFAARHFATLPGGTIDLWRRRGASQFPDYYQGGEFSLDYAFYDDALEYEDLGPWDFDFPVTILHGANDEILPVDDSVELCNNIHAPSVTLDIVPGGDHRLSAAIPLMCDKLDDLWQLK